MSLDLCEEINKDTNTRCVGICISIQIMREMNVVRIHRGRGENSSSLVAASLGTEGNK